MESKFKEGDRTYFNRAKFDFDIVEVYIRATGSESFIENLKIEFANGNIGYCHASQLRTKQELLEMIEEL